MTGRLVPQSPLSPRLVVSRSTCPLLSPSPPREQLCNRSCSNKHTDTHRPRLCRGKRDLLYRQKRPAAAIPSLSPKSKVQDPDCVESKETYYTGKREQRQPFRASVQDPHCCLRFCAPAINFTPLDDRARGERKRERTRDELRNQQVWWASNQRVTCVVYCPSSSPPPKPQF